MSHPSRTAAVACVGLMLTLADRDAASAQVGAPFTPSGRQLQAADGDTVVVDGDDRVSLVRRRQAHVRVVADETAGTVLVIADWGTRESAQPDGRVNRTWRFAGVDGRWPLESRWEADAVMFVPDKPPVFAGPALSLETSAGVIAFIGGPPRPVADPTVILRYSSMSSGGREGATFDEAEREALSPNFMTSVSTMSFGSGGGVGFGTGQMVETFEAAVPAPGRRAPAGAGPVLQAMPRIVQRVPPVWPQAARDADVRGMVIIQADVTTDGTVRDARVLRGVPMLDAAAVEAVRQWRFEPAGSDGRPDPVTVTVMVQFPPQP